MPISYSPWKQRNGMCARYFEKDMYLPAILTVLIETVSLGGFLEFGGVLAQCCCQRWWGNFMRESKCREVPAMEPPRTEPGELGSMARDAAPKFLVHANRKASKLQDSFPQTTKIISYNAIHHHGDKELVRSDQDPLLQRLL
jgi:hypothetical protein